MTYLPTEARSSDRAPAPNRPPPCWVAPCGHHATNPGTDALRPALGQRKDTVAPMTTRFPNPLRLVWRYMRGEDLKEADAAAVVRAQAARATAPVGIATQGGAHPPTSLSASASS